MRLAVGLQVLGGGSRFETEVTVPFGKTVILGNMKMDVPRNPLILTVKPELVK